MLDIVLASNNQGKVREFEKLLAHLPLRLLTLKDIGYTQEIVEDGPTFAENALIKAETIFKHTGLWTIADDSGLEVPYLGGQPGVHSARYAGDNATDQDNNAKLLLDLAAAQGEERRGIFVSEIAILGPGKIRGVYRGECRGLILNEPRGSRGFGYDPLFYLPEFDKTYAEMTQEEKNEISHRGKAMLKTQKALQEFFKKI